MVKQIIAAQNTENVSVKQTPNEPYLNISEFYYDTIQGEGISMGVPAAFLRLQGCSLNCVFCDTKEVWRRGNPYSLKDLFTLMEGTDIIPKLLCGQHIVITGGSPLLQQETLIEFLKEFYNRYSFLPYSEIENECTITPHPKMLHWIAQWNNSPKLFNSGVIKAKRYIPEVIKLLSSLSDSWFKFVVSSEEDWEEIRTDFIDACLINHNQIILMPQGATREELEKNRETVVNMAIEHGVRYSDRLHIELWDNQKGV